MNDKVRIVIEVSGGVVQEVYTSDPDAVDVTLIDYDVDTEEAAAEVEELGERAQADVAVGRLTAVAY